MLTKLTIALILFSTSVFSEVVRKVVQTDRMTINSTVPAGTNYSTTIVIPSNSIITHAWVLVLGKVVSSSNNKLAISCETYGDIFAPLVLTSYGVKDILSSTGKANYFFSDGCTVIVSVKSGASGLTDGDILLGVEYITRGVLN